MRFSVHTTNENYSVVLNPPLSTGSDTFQLAQNSDFGGLHFQTKQDTAPLVTIDPSTPPIGWRLRMTGPAPGNLAENEVEDLLLVLGYNWD